MPEAVDIKSTPLIKAIEDARKEFELKGYTVEVAGIEKCHLTGYQDTDTPMTDLALVTCLEDAYRTYRVYNSLLKRAMKELDIKKPVWVIIFRLNTGLEMVAEILEHTDQLEFLFQQMKQKLKK